MRPPVKALLEKYIPADHLELLESVEEKYGFTVRVFDHDLNADGERTILDVARVKMKNVKGVEERALSIKPGVTLIHGPNDSGKSTCLDAFTFALSGRTFGAGAENQHLMRDEKAATECTVEMEGGDSVYRAVRKKTKLKGKDAGTVEMVYDLEVVLAGVEGKNKRDAEANLSLYLAAPFETIRSLCMTDQGQMTRILDNQPAVRRELFYKMLALEPCELTRKELAAVVAREEQELRDIVNSVSVNRQVRKDQTEIIARVPEDIEHQVAECRAWLSDYANRQVEVRELSSQLQLRRKTFGDLEVHTARRLVIDQEISETEAWLAQHSEKKIDFAEAEEHMKKCEESARAAVISIQKLSSQMEAVKAKGTALKTLPAVCETCAAIGKHCELSDETKAQVREKLLEEYRAMHKQWLLEVDNGKAADDAVVSAHKWVRGLKDQWSHIELATVQLRNLKVEKQNLLVGDVENERLAIEALSKRIVEATPNAADAGTVTVRLNGLLERLREKEQAIGALRVAEEKLLAADSVDEREQRIIKIRRLSELFAKPGIPLRIATQELEEVNAYADEFSADDDYRYYFDGDLAVSVASRVSKVHVHPALACGSARQRGALCLMASLGRWLQRRLQITIPIFWVDEIPFQDDSKAGLIVSMMKRLQSWFSKVVFISSSWEQYLGKFDHEVPIGMEVRPSVTSVLQAHQAEITMYPAAHSRGPGVFVAPDPYDIQKPQVEPVPLAQDSPASRPNAERPRAKACSLHASQMDPEGRFEMIVVAPGECSFQPPHSLEGAVIPAESITWAPEPIGQGVLVTATTAPEPAFKEPPDIDKAIRTLVGIGDPDMGGDPF